MNDIQLEKYDKTQLVTDRWTVHLYVRQLAIYHRLYIIIMCFLILYTSLFVGNKLQKVYVSLSLSLTYHQYHH
jgi:hypothetical protein